MVANVESPFDWWLDSRTAPAEGKQFGAAGWFTWHEGKGLLHVGAGCPCPRIQVLFLKMLFFGTVADTMTSYDLYKWDAPI